VFEPLSHRMPALPCRAAAICAAAAVIGVTSPVAIAAIHGHAASPPSSPAGRDAHHLWSAQRSVRQTAVLVLPDGTRQDFGTDIRGCLLAPVPVATGPTAPSHHELETGPHCVISGG
jgi:hypothetical protein